MKNLIRFCFLTATLFTLCHCVPYEEEILTEINLDYTDPLLQQLYNFQDQQIADSLYPFFDHPDPTYRHAAVRAFSSFNAPNAIAQISSLLADPVLEVRSMAAYVLGQMKQASGADPLTRAFDNQDTLGFNRLFNARILEAVGKCGTEEHLDFISSVRNYSNRDSLLLLGQAQAIYQFMLRDIVSEQGTAVMIDRVSDVGTPLQAKLYAAHYLQRAKDISLTEYMDKLLATLRREKNAEVRIALAAAVAKSGVAKALPVIKSLLNSDPDYRVQVNVLRHIGRFSYSEVNQAVATQLLSARSPHIVDAAATYFIEHGQPTEASAYRRMALDSMQGIAQIRMLQAANKYLPAYFEQTKNYLNFDLKQRFNNTDKPYEKAALLDALSEYPWNYRVIHGLGYELDIPIVRVATIRALGHIAANPDFNSYFGLSSRAVSTELAQYFQYAIESADLGLITEAALQIADGKLSYKQLYQNADFLKTAQQRIPLPEGTETYYALQAAIDYMEGTSTSPTSPKYNHPINWGLVEAIGTNTRALISTTRGDIRMRFYPKQAPATVANFIQLAKKGYYDGKYFHRVVPNFVIQGGCERGDGYGSADYSLRSELPPLYYDKTGCIGMASAGTHTESTQFFITHSPTPHLNGRYTLFGLVTEGMDVVHSIVQGDKVVSIKILE